ncbi:hypothetical protein DRP05_15080 [Archaeoglobales archaeon]|mgnify:CR=1 FL=1|nr:MAG: hypothetical protein DRP05_15080 [Archaeoglobales archaeon]
MIEVENIKKQEQEDTVLCPALGFTMACLKSKCAWYDKNEEQCAVLTIAQALGFIAWKEAIT